MITIKKLKCGTTLIMEKTDYVQSAAIGIWVKSGAIYETDQISGISHFIEHMMFKGTENRSAREIANDVDKIGGVFNAFTGKEATCYYIKTLSSNIYKGAGILLDMVTNSVFDQTELDKERNVILEEIKMVKDTPDEDVYDTILELVNNHNPLKMNILGTPESLSGINREEMVTYYRHRYSRENIVVSVSGNFDEDKMVETFEEALAGLNQDTADEPMEISEYTKQFDVKVKDIEQSHICLAVPGVSMMDDMYYAFVLMNNIFGGSMSSRLFQKIREEKGLAYSVYSMNAFNSFSGFFNIYAGVAHDKRADTISAIKEELHTFAREGATEDELAMAKEQVKSSYIFGQENINSRMITLGKNKLLIDKVFTPEEILAGFDSVTNEDILKAASVIGNIDNYSAAAVTGEEFDLKGLLEHDH
ncbi:MAG: pitrilysin family protein [Bacillota bacterium]|nr:pitrilysin family protein [Bacillota bacterium]